MATDSEVSGGRVGKSVAWSALNAMVLRLSQFLVGVLVARLVSPHEYGVFVVALTVYIIVFSFSDIGVTAAVVRERDRVDQIAPTVSAIAMGTSAVLALG
ncbi:MAG: oligosaccharide flippase family protein, partial [Mycobacterium sp.]|nr:oligosaccharide flippase family protein [Mycobacterium sp.]